MVTSPSCCFRDLWWRERGEEVGDEERVIVRDSIWGRGGEVKGAWGLFDLGKCEQGQ